MTEYFWEKVLRKNPTLHLCLAHFGGEEEWEYDEKEPMVWAEKLAEMAANTKWRDQKQAVLLFAQQRQENQIEVLLV